MRAPRRNLQRTYASFTSPDSRRQRNSFHQRDSDEIAAANSNDRLPVTRFEKNRQEWFKSRGVRPSTKAKKPNFDTDGALKKHLQYLQDPVKLSEYIRKILRTDDFETAEKVIQYASKTIQCVVSWNHLVYWQLSKGRMNAAIQTFNDMKKRAQTPDAHTYTIIFRGCADHKDSARALEKVLAIYHSMSADKCPVKPNTIHVNAVLKMCAKAGDMDAMFAIADHLPEKGLRARNNLTYTTILNGLRSKLTRGNRVEMTSVQQRQDAQNHIMTARHIWTDIVKRWRMGDIWIDEELVCAMGRLMLLGSERDADDVFSLLEQTMSIPRQFAPKGQFPSPDYDDQALEATSQSTGQPSEPIVSSGEVLSTSGETPPTDPKDDAIIPFTEIIKHNNFPPKGVSPYPLPGRNTLSLLMATLLAVKSRSSPKQYWTYLTSPPHSIIPDAENYAAYLRILRVTRSSSAVVSVLSTMPKDNMTHGTFRIAMSTCLRDKNNPHAFANAGKVLDYMQSALTTPDPQVLEAYLDLAITAPVQIISSPICNTGLPSADERVLKKRTHGRIISRALHRLTPCYVSLRATLAYGDERTPVVQGQHREELRSAMVRLAQRMVSAYDMLLNMGMVERTYYIPISQERAKLAAFITRIKHQARTGAERSRTVEAHERKVNARETEYKSYTPERRAEPSEADVPA